MNLYEKMLKITTEISAVNKNLSVDTGNGKGYKAVSEVDVLTAVRPIEAKYGIYSYPQSRRVIDSGTIVNTTKYGEKKQLYIRIETVYRFVNTENPDEFLDIVSYGDGVDSQDKAPGKAMTYSDKYALLKAYKIRTGEDLDAEASDDLVSIEKEIPEDMKPCTETEIKLVESICRTYKKKPEDGFPAWPNITKGDYAEFMRQVNQMKARQEKKRAEA